MCHQERLYKEVAYICVGFRYMTYCFRCGATGGGGGQLPPYDLFFLVSSAVGHGHDNTPTPLFKKFGKFF